MGERSQNPGMPCALKSSPSEFTRSRKLKDKPVFHVMIP